MTTQREGKSENATNRTSRMPGVRVFVALAWFLLAGAYFALEGLGVIHLPRWASVSMLAVSAGLFLLTWRDWRRGRRA